MIAAGPPKSSEPNPVGGVEDGTVVQYCSTVALRTVKNIYTLRAVGLGGFLGRFCYERSLALREG